MASSGRKCCTPASLIRFNYCVASLWLLGCGAARADIYVADPFARAIYQLVGGGGLPSTFSREANRPTGLAFDHAGNLYQSDIASGNVYKYAAKGTQSVFVGGLAMPFGLAFDRAGAFYVAAVDADGNTGSVLKITPAGVRTTFVEGLKSIRGLAFDREDNLYVAEASTGTILRVAPDGTRKIFASGVTSATGLAFDASGNLFVCGQGGSVSKISPAGEVSIFTTNVVDPRWLAFDATGNLYVTDVGDASGRPGHGRVYMFAPNGERTLIDNTLSFPTGLVIGTMRAGAADITGLEAVSDIGAGGQLTFDLTDGSGTPLMVGQGGRAIPTPTATPATRKDGGNEKASENSGTGTGGKPTGAVNPGP